MTDFEQELHLCGGLTRMHYITDREREEFSENDYGERFVAFRDDMFKEIAAIIKYQQDNLGQALFELNELIEEATAFANNSGYHDPEPIVKMFHDCAVYAFAEEWGKIQVKKATGVAH